MPQKPRPAVAIIGPGRVGQSLGRLLREAGVPIGWVAARRATAARKAARFIGAGKPITLYSPEIARDAGGPGILLITTSDSALPEVARTLAARRPNWRGKIVLHTSGAWKAGGEASVLDGFRKRGAAAASLHPLQTVPDVAAGVRNLVGCVWALEGDSAGVKIAKQWVSALRGKAFTLPSSRKAAYHAAAVISCGGVVALMESSERLLALCGLDPMQAREMLETLVAGTARNFAALGARRALTGPVARGDWVTVCRHLAVLRKDAPDLVGLYEELLRSMLKIAGRRAPAGMLRRRSVAVAKREKARRTRRR